MARRINSVLNAALSRRNAFGAVCLWCFLFGFCVVPASLAQYRFDSWTTDNGLPHNTIRGIWQTRDGYLWLTTADGVARFDGVRFRVFNKANTPGLTTNHFAFGALWEDRQSNLWMGTVDRGVVRYRDGQFITLTTDDGLPSNSVLRIDEDEEGTVWIFTEGGLAQWKDGRLIRVAPAPGSPFNDCLDDPRKYLGVDGRLHGLWRMNSSGWQRFAYGRWTPLPLPPHLSDPTKLRLSFIYEDAHRNLWYSLADREGEYYRVKDGRLSVLRNVHPDGRSYVCYQDRQGRVWSGSHSGLNGFWKDGHFTPLPELPTSNVFRMLEDREGGLWIATFFEGLYRLREQFVTFHRPAGRTNYKTAKTAGAMFEDSRGNVWLRSAALAKFNDGHFTNYYRAGRERKAWDWGNVVSALCEDRDGSIWVATWDGIARFRDGQLYEEPSISEQIKGRVHVMNCDRAGNIWFGMESGGGLYRLRDGSLTHYTTRDGLGDNSVGVILEDHASRLWIGTDRGLSCYTGDRFETPDVAEELSSLTVNSLHEDAAGVLWIGTSEHGLCRLDIDEESPTLTRYTTKQGLLSNRVDLILEDESGFVWMACNIGLFRVRKRELEDYARGQTPSITSTWFGKAQGLVNGENGAFAEPVGYGFKGRDSKLWFSTREGIAVVDPKAVTFNSTPPPIMIEECELDRRPAAFQNGLKINPGQENLEIDYTALSLVRSEQIRFRYKLDGLDQDWVEAWTRRTAYYSHVPPGKYVFRVIAANSDGVWNLEGQSLRIVVLPPFYRTWWFLTLVGLIATGVVLLGYEYRVRHLRRARDAQQAFARQLIESQEQERKRIAAELHDGLGQSLAMIKNSAVFGAHTVGDVEAAKNQLADISTQSAQAISEVREIAYNLRPYLLDRLGLTKAIKAMLDKIGDTYPTRLKAQIDEVSDLFSAEAEMSIYRIIQESLNNIIKHSQATEAVVTIRKTERAVAITIEDNGQGFDVQARGDGGAGKRGFGLLGMAERVRMLGGTQIIDSAPGRGTIITVNIKLTTGERNGAGGDKIKHRDG